MTIYMKPLIQGKFSRTSGIFTHLYIKGKVIKLTMNALKTPRNLNLPRLSDAEEAVHGEE